MFFYFLERRRREHLNKLKNKHRTNSTFENLKSNEKFQKILSQSKTLIGQNKSFEAISAIEEYFISLNIEMPDEIVLLRNNFVQTRKDVGLGLIENKEANLIFNRINSSLLAYIAEMKSLKL